MFRSLKALAFGIATVVLASCAAVTGIDSADFDQLSPVAQVEVLKESFNTHLDLLIDYRSQPECSETVVVGCYDAKVYDRLAVVATEVDMALDAAEAAAASGAANTGALVMSARGFTLRFVNEMIAQELAQ